LRHHQVASFLRQQCLLSSNLFQFELVTLSEFYQDSLRTLVNKLQTSLFGICEMFSTARPHTKSPADID
jgi:hypothetical protein